MLEGTPMDVEDHPAYNKPNATEHYAGDVIRFPMSENTSKILKDTAPTEPVPGTPTGSIIPLVKKPK